MENLEIKTETGITLTSKLSTRNEDSMPTCKGCYFYDKGGCDQCLRGSEVIDRNHKITLLEDDIIWVKA